MENHIATIAAWNRFVVVTVTWNSKHRDRASLSMSENGMRNRRLLSLLALVLRKSLLQYGTGGDKAGTKYLVANQIIHFQVPSTLEGRQPHSLAR